MLGGLKLLLDSCACSPMPTTAVCPRCWKSREAQARFDRSGRAGARRVARIAAWSRRRRAKAHPRTGGSRPGHLYEGLLTVLMRLVFMLYAEDRDLLPSRLSSRAGDLRDELFGARSLREARRGCRAQPRHDGRAARRLGAAARAVPPDPQGASPHFIQARGGKLFDPDNFPFSKGAPIWSNRRACSRYRTAAFLRILEGLMTLQMRGGDARAAFISRARRRADRLGLRDGDGFHRRDRRARARHQGWQAQPHPGICRSRKTRRRQGQGTHQVSEGGSRSQPALGECQARLWRQRSRAADLAAALDPIVDERGSPKKQMRRARRCCSRPTNDAAPAATTRRESHRADRRYALEPAFERLGPDATPEQILDLKVCDPAMGSGAFLVEACRALAARLVAAWSRYPRRGRPFRRTRTRSCTRAVWSRSAASTASTRTRSPPISPSCRSGSPRSRAITSSPSSITR